MLNKLGNLSWIKFFKEHNIYFDFGIKPLSFACTVRVICTVLFVPTDESSGNCSVITPVDLFMSKNP